MLEERLRFETLLSGVSAGLIHVPASAIDAALARALQQVAMFLGMDRGSRSKVSIPLSAGGPVLGVLSFGSVRSERVWPAELVERLPLLGAAFASTLERKRMELSLAERVRFEKLLSSLSTALSQLSAGDFVREVQRALHRVVDFLGVARASLIEFSRDGSTAHSWAIEGRKADAAGVIMPGPL